MNEMIASCGLKCHECPAYIALKENDQELREKTAKEWSEIYKTQLQPQDINCEGCLSNNGVLFGHCYKCEIRKCCRGKQLDNCALCEDYGCKIISEFFEYAPEAKENLDKIHAQK